MVSGVLNVGGNKTMESLLGPGLPYCITVAELFYPPSTLFLKESLFRLCQCFYNFSYLTKIYPPACLRLLYIAVTKRPQSSEM